MSGGIDAEDVADLRADLLDFLPDHCTIYAPPDADNPLPDSDGNIDRSFPSAWTALVTNEPCGVEMSRYMGQEKASAGVPVGVDFNDIRFKHTAPLKQSYRIKITAATYETGFVGMVFDVNGVILDSFGVNRIAQVQRKDIDV